MWAPAAREQARSQTLIAAGVIAAGISVLAWLGRPLVSGEVHTAADLANFYLPVRAFYARCLAEGWSFLWWPHQFTGYYLHGEGQGGLLHPWNWLLYRWLPLPVAFDLEILRGYAMLALGSWLWLRRLALPRDAAALGTFALTFSGFTTLHWMHLNIVAAVAHLPWLLYALDAALRPRNAGEARLAWLAVVLLTISQCLVGHPQLLWMCGLVEGLAALFTIVGSGRPGTASALVRWACAKVLGVAGAAVALWPVAASLDRSFRAAPPAGFVSDLAVHPIGLVQLVGPYLFETRVVGENTVEMSLYLGAATLSLCVWVLVRGRALGAAWRPACAALVLMLLGIVLALGEKGGLYALQLQLPVVGLFRAPGRYVLLAQVGAALVVAIGFADLARPALAGARDGVRAPGRWLLLPFVLSVAAALLVPLVGAGVPGADTSSALGLATGPLLLGTSTLLVFLAARGSRAALVALALFIVADTSAYGLSWIARSPPATIQALLDRYSAPANPDAGRLQWGPPVLTVKDVRLAGGYAALSPSRVLDLGLDEYGGIQSTVHTLRFEPRLVNALRVSNVRWAFLPGLPPPLPRARLVAEVRVSEQPNVDIGSVDVDRVALVAEPLDWGGGQGGEPGTATILRDTPGELVVGTSAPGGRLLVVSESYHAGWRAAIDGEPADIVRVYGDYQGVVVEPGLHEVRLVFDPPGLRGAAWVAIAALALALAWTAARWGRAGQRQAASEDEAASRSPRA